MMRNKKDFRHWKSEESRFNDGHPKRRKAEKFGSTNNRSRERQQLRTAYCA